jgi:hypothetical protein
MCAFEEEPAWQLSKQKQLKIVSYVDTSFDCLAEF